MNDFRFALRQLLKNPGFTAIAVLCLALGIGGTIGIFSVVNSVLLRPLPYADSERLMRIYTEFPTFPNGGLRRFAFSTPEFFDLQREAKSWESLDAWANSGVNLSSATEPVRATATFITGGMMQSLGVSPLIGRAVLPGDDKPGAPIVANISYGLWQRAFAGDPGILGRKFVLNGDSCTVIGVMPKEFQFPPGTMDPSELWVPLQLDRANPGDRGGHNHNVLGRLKTGVSAQQAREEIAALQKHWAATSSGHIFDATNHSIVTYGLHDEVVRGVRPALQMLMGAVGFLLLIGCVNVANLLLARAESRQKEIAIRAAMGAGAGRLAAQFLIEGLLLSVAGVAAGLLLAQAALSYIKSASVGSMPRVSEIAMDGNVAFFATATCLLTGIAFGLAPLSHVLKRNLQGALKSSATSTTGGTSTQGFRHLLVMGELGLALVLLAGTGLMIRAFWKLQEVQAGFESKNVLTMRAELSAPYTAEMAGSLWTRLDEKLAGLPGAESVAISSGLPPVYSANFNDTPIEGFVPKKGGPIENVQFIQTVTPNYFATLRMRLVDGRFLDRRDNAQGTSVAVVNETLARTFWGNRSAVGQRLRPSWATNWCTIVGVVADSKNDGLEKPTGTEVYYPFAQEAGRGGLGTLNLTIRSSLAPTAMAAAARQEIRNLDAALPIARVSTMDDLVEQAQSRPRFLATLLTAFAGVALALAAIGIYGVISYSVAQRTREFGVRIALGAAAGDILGNVLKRGMVLAAAGILIGLAGAFSLTHLLSTLLFGVTPTDSLTFGVVCVLLAFVALISCYIPARRATKVDPMVTLRSE